MRIAIPLLALLLAGCGGRIADAPETCAEQACDAWAKYGPSHGAYVCPEGGYVIACCGYTRADLEQLAAEGDIYAPQCLGDR